MGKKWLDNAHDEKQVRPLLPGNKRCAVLITSRPALSALEGASAIKLGLMPCEEALELLAKTAGLAETLSPTISRSLSIRSMEYLTELEEIFRWGDIIGCRWNRCAMIKGAG